MASSRCHDSVIEYADNTGDYGKSKENFDLTIVDCITVRPRSPLTGAAPIDRRGDGGDSRLNIADSDVSGAACQLLVA
jgi:hypothetical protein